MKKWKYILIAALLSGCGSVQQGDFEPVFLKPQATPGSFFLNTTDPRFVEAANFWNAQLGTEVFRFDGGFAEVEVNYHPNTEILKFCGDRNTEGWDEGACTTVIFSYNNRDVTNWSCSIDVAEDKSLDVQTPAHELGHCLGLDHDVDPSSIMNNGDEVSPLMIEELLNNMAVFPLYLKAE